MNHDLHPNRLMRIYMWFYMQRANFGNAQHPSLRNENTQEVLWYQNLSTIEFSRNVYSQSINYTLSASIYSQWAIFHVPLSRLKSIGTANAILHCTKHKMLSIARNLDLLYFGFSMIDNFFLPLWKFFSWYHANENSLILYTEIHSSNCINVEKHKVFTSYSKWNEISLFRLRFLPNHFCRWVCHCRDDKNHGTS